MKHQLKKNIPIWTIMACEKLYVLGKCDHEISRSRQVQEMVFFKTWNKNNHNPQLSAVAEIFQASPDLLHYTLDFNIFYCLSDTCC